MEGDVRYGWLKLDGIQDGDRTPAEQLLAVWPAIHDCTGKTVMDLGCAEGAISLEFAKAGASEVLGIDSIADHLAVAKSLCAAASMKTGRIRFECHDLQEFVKPWPHDIVLCLGIIHKLRFPERGLRFAAKSCRELLLLRSGRGSVNGIIRGKFHQRNTCDSAKLLAEEGFVLEKVVDGPPEREEPVEYWRRVK